MKALPCFFLHTKTPEVYYWIAFLKSYLKEPDASTYIEKQMRFRHIWYFHSGKAAPKFLDGQFTNRKAGNLNIISGSFTGAKII
jgi:hypothetical protein